MLNHVDALRNRGIEQERLDTLAGMMGPTELGEHEVRIETIPAYFRTPEVDLDLTALVLASHIARSVALTMVAPEREPVAYFDFYVSDSPLELSIPYHQDEATPLLTVHGGGTFFVKGLDPFVQDLAGDKGIRALYPLLRFFNITLNKSNMINVVHEWRKLGIGATLMHTGFELAAAAGGDLFYIEDWTREGWDEALDTTSYYNRFGLHAIDRVQQAIVFPLSVRGVRALQMA